MNKNVLLIFPPLTEARFFPYLSLPMLTSFLRKHDIEVHQEDLNISLNYKLASIPTIKKYKRKLARDSHSKSKIAVAIRDEMSNFILNNYDSIFGYIFQKTKDRDPILEGHELDFIRKTVEMILEGSILKKEIHSFEEMDNEIANINSIPMDDLAAKILFCDINSLIKKNKYQIIGLSVPFYSQVLPSLLIAKCIKRISPHVKVILGGPQIIQFSQQIMKMRNISLYVDYLGLGDGEETILYLHKYLNNMASYNEIPDIYNTSIPIEDQLVTRSKLHISEKPIPDFDGLPIYNYMSHGVQLGVISCVGCSWGRCTFCSYGNRYKNMKTYQQKRVKQIADEFQFLINKYRITRINFIDENTNIKLIMNSMKILLERGYSAEFSIRCRLENIFLDKDFCYTLKSLGCTQLSVGYETYSQRVLDIIDKGVESSNFQQIINNIYEAGIELRLNIIGGLPTETQEEAMKSLEFLQLNENKIGIDVIQMLVAEPQSLLVIQNNQNLGLEIKTNENILIGNKNINYGMGRMGYKIEYKEGANYEERRGWMMKILKEVKPLLNSEIQKKNNDVIYKKNMVIKLLPWVSVLVISEGNTTVPYVVNLLFEKVYFLPDTVEHVDRTIEPKSIADSETIHTIEQLIDSGLAELIYPN